MYTAPGQLGQSTLHQDSRVSLHCTRTVGSVYTAPGQFGSVYTAPGQLGQCTLHQDSRVSLHCTRTVGSVYTAPGQLGQSTLHQDSWVSLHCTRTVGSVYTAPGQFGSVQVLCEQSEDNVSWRGRHKHVRPMVCVCWSADATQVQIKESSPPDNHQGTDQQKGSESILSNAQNS